MRRLFLRIVIGAIAAAVVLQAAVAQQPKPYRVGVVREGGPDSAAGDGLKEGLKDK